MDEDEHLAFDDLRSDSDATADGCSLGHQPHGSGVTEGDEVHAWESEVEELCAGGVQGPHSPHMCKFVKVYSRCNIM